MSEPTTGDSLTTTRSVGEAAALRNRVDASPEDLWRTLADFRSFPTWNPFIRQAKGKLVPGKRLKIKLKLGRRIVKFRPRVTLVNEPLEPRWRARQWIPGLFDVDRRFLIEPVGERRARFVQSESGSGLLSPLLMPLMRRRILRHYDEFNRAVKARVER